MTTKTIFTVCVILTAALVFGTILLLGAEQLCLGSTYLFGQPASYREALFRFVIALIIMVGVILGCTKLFGWLYSKYS